MKLSDQQLSLLKNAANVFRAFNNPQRPPLIEYLTTERSVTEIYTHFKIEQSVCSQQLAILRNEGIVTVRKEAKFIYYKANPVRINQVLKLAEQLIKF